MAYISELDETSNSDISLKELCKELSISVATGKNWMKLGKIKPRYTKAGTPFFNKKDVKKLKKDIQSGKNKALKSRRNKKYVSGNELYDSYVSDTCQARGAIRNLLQTVEKNKIVLEEDMISWLVADCAIKLFVQRYDRADSLSEILLSDFLEGRLDLGTYHSLFWDLIDSRDKARTWILQHPDLFQTQYYYEEREDILGLLYLSCKNLGNRKATGAYYTPTAIVRQMIQKLTEKNGMEGHILDPCCGTGNFLLQLPEEFPLQKIHGMDIDGMSVKIARLNMALRFLNADRGLICQNIIRQNYLLEDDGRKYDFIIGNPPWGYSFGESEQKYIRKHFVSAKGENIESYDVFLEKSLSRLNKDGALSFVLPEAVLNVKSHMPVRQSIVEAASVQYLEYLGNAFYKVQCPCIIFQLQYTGKKMNCIGMEIKEHHRQFEISQEREVSPESFSFTMTDDEYRILKKLMGLQNVTFLKDNAEFALGIVTGNNKERLSDQKSRKSEIILKGSDICKFRWKKPSHYIVFQPEKFQQVAPEEYYRAPEKLLYRFICNQLVFAYDDRQTLSLNSCNIVIPRIPFLSMKYVLAVLNSRIAQFLFQKRFNSVKVLRSHIEQIPIPQASKEEQEGLAVMVDSLRRKRSETAITALYEKIDNKIRQLYLLSDKEYQTIKKAVDGENNFLV